MTLRQRDSLLRLVIVCAAWALGDALEYLFNAGSLGPVASVIFAVAAYLATRDLSWPGGGGGRGDTYWRGQRVDRDRWRR